MSGVVILVVAVVAALAFGLYRRRVDGRFAAAAAPSLWRALGAAGVDGAPGERATLVQFSSAFCQPCRATRRVLDEVSGLVPGVRHLEIDAEQHLQLTRDLDIQRTPTTIVLDADGVERSRAAGAPTRDQVMAALAGVVPPAADADR